MDFKRIFSGTIVVIAVVLLMIIPSNIVINLLLTVLTVIAMHEYINAISKIAKPVKWILYVSCALGLIIRYIPKEWISNVLLFSVPSVMLILFAHVIATDMKISFRDIAYTLFGMCYVSFFLMFLILILGMDNGKVLFIYTLIAAWITDTCAYVAGSRIGKHKFSKVSPKKSIEGCVIGTLSSILVAVIYTVILNKCFAFNYSYIIMAVIGMVLSLIGQIGDFSASCIKRYVDIKDYSNLLPGHGGLLDRMDSILFIAPFAYMLFMVI